MTFIFSYCLLLLLSALKPELRPKSFSFLHPVHLASQNFLARIGFLAGDTLFNDSKEPQLWRDYSQCLEVLAIQQDQTRRRVYEHPTCSSTSTRWTPDPRSEVMYKVLKALQFSLFAPAEIKAESLSPRTKPKDVLLALTNFYCQKNLLNDPKEVHISWSRKVIRLDTLETQETPFLNVSWSCENHAALQSVWRFPPPPKNTEVE